MVRFGRSRARAVVPLEGAAPSSGRRDTQLGSLARVLASVERLGGSVPNTVVVTADIFRHVVNTALPPGHDPASLVRTIRRPIGRRACCTRQGAAALDPAGRRGRAGNRCCLRRAHAGVAMGPGRASEPGSTGSRSLSGGGALARRAAAEDPQRRRRGDPVGVGAGRIAADARAPARTQGAGSRRRSRRPARRRRARYRDAAHRSAGSRERRARGGRASLRRICACWPRAG